MTHASATLLSVLVVPAVVAAGCSTAKTTARKNGDPAAAGINYFLPQKRVKFIATRTLLDNEKLKAELGKAEEAFKGAESAAKAAKAKADQEKAIYDKLESGTPAKTDAEKNWKRAVAESAVATENSEKAKLAVNKVKGDLWDAQMGAGNCTYNFTAKFEVLASEPDTTHAFTLIPTHSAFRDDEVKLAVQPNGLLASANVVAIDQTGSILIELAGAIAAVQAPKYEMHLKDTNIKPEACEKETRYFQYVFDPVLNEEPSAQANQQADKLVARQVDAEPAEAKDHAVATLNSRLENAGFPYRIRSTGTAITTKMDNTGSVVTKPDAIYYRTATPYVLTVFQCDDPANCDYLSANSTSARPTDALLVQLPQGGPISYVPMTSSAFVKTVNDVTFVDGSLTAWNSNRPSEVLEVVRLPVKILKSVMEVPASIFSVRVNHNTAEASLIESQQAQLETSLRIQALKDCLNKNADATATEQLTCFPE